ncbi:MAG TPA: two-component regulator propeller domain-containing protein [Kofleriaceae bacterium]|nr:two-component regulator propeller domain-containing protein [Kofleriaceae bacterium]
MRVRVVAVGAVVLLWAAGDAQALDSHRRATQYAQTHYESRDGMPHGLANSIAQTADGYLWTGSEEGLARFDGASFTTFDHRKTDGIPANMFTALAVDPAGQLWAGTREHGVVHFVDGEFRAVAWEPGPQEQQIRALAFDRAGDLWIGMHDRGLVRLHAGVVAGALTTRDGLPSDDVRAIFAARDGTLWIGTFGGLVQLRAGRIAPGPAALAGVAIHEFAQDARGELWAATASGLAHLHGDTAELVGADRLPTTDIRRVLFDRDGNLWIGTAGGAARMTPDGRIDLLAQPAAMILALFEDSEHNVWIGSEKGLDRLRDGDVLPFGSAEGGSDDIAFGIQEDPTGAMWITSSGGLHRLAPGAAAATAIVSDQRTMYAIYPDSHGDVWFGARDGGIGRWHDGQFTWLGKRPWERIRSLSETADGMWIGTEHGLFRLRGDRLDDAELIVPDVAVSVIVPDASGALWLGTEGGGLLRWSGGALVPIPPGGPRKLVPVPSILVDPDGTLWVGTEGAGLWRLRGTTWSVITAKDGMLDDLIWRILDDGRGKLWMSSNRGIWSVTRDDLEAKASGRRTTVAAVLYGVADGMRDRECNGAISPAGWRARDGRLWFPTVKGAVIIDPARLQPTRPPGTLLESLRIDGQTHPLTAALELAPGSSRLELGYTAPALRSPERLRFRYRLDGFDRTWNDAGALRVAQYTNLAPGNYKFVVEAGIDGQWGRAAAIDVTLHPRFRQTTGFFVLAIAAIALALVAIPLLRVRQLRARALELHQRVQEAVSELKVLSGLLPICAWCKKVRDDGGYWSKIEAYLSARTDAQFTHGICPECNDKVLAEDGGHGHAHDHDHHD